MTKPQLLLIGGGGHCHSVIDAIEQQNRYEIIVIVSNSNGYSVIVANGLLVGLYRQYLRATIKIYVLDLINHWNHLLISCRLSFRCWSMVLDRHETTNA